VDSTATFPFGVAGNVDGLLLSLIRELISLRAKTIEFQGRALQALVMALDTSLTRAMMRSRSACTSRLPSFCWNLSGCLSQPTAAASVTTARWHND
jgi:hypothetical protein